MSSSELVADDELERLREDAATAMRATVTSEILAIAFGRIREALDDDSEGPARRCNKVRTILDELADPERFGGGGPAALLDLLERTEGDLAQLRTVVADKVGRAHDLADALVASAALDPKPQNVRDVAQEIARLLSDASEQMVEPTR